MQQCGIFRLMQEASNNSTAPATGTTGTVAPPRGDAVSTADGNVNQGNSGQGQSVVDVTKIDAETTPVTKEPSAGAQTFSLLDAELGEIEELKTDGFYSNLKPEDVRAMDPLSRRILHNVRIEARQRIAEAQRAAQEADARAETKAAAVAQAEKDLVRRQREFAAIARNPEIKKLLALPEGELPDATTPEGIEARIKRDVALGLKAFLEPMEQAAAAEDAKLRYLDFVEKNPEMKDPATKKQVADLVRSRAEAGVPISTADALQLVKADRAIRAQQQQAEQVRAARHLSATHAAPRSGGASTGTQDIPPEVRKGGAVAIANFLRNNQGAAAKIRSNLYR